MRITFTANTDRKANMQITLDKSFNYCRQPQWQTVVKAEMPDYDINTSCKRLKNSQEMKTDQIPSEMLVEPDNSSLMTQRDLCNGAWEKEIFPHQWEHWSVI